MNNKYTFLLAVLIFSIVACKPQSSSYTHYDEYPAPTSESLWLDYSRARTIFKVWSPTAEDAKVNFYITGSDTESTSSKSMLIDDNGIWRTTVKGDLHGMYYTYQIKHKGKWLDETPGIYAQAVGVNGERAMVINHELINPLGWKEDKTIEMRSPNDAIIYELHIRDMSIHSSSGAKHRGKYLGLIEEGTKGPNGVKTGIDHLKELGITHVHLLPTYDHYSINEMKLDSAQFNWGYDPQNYNVPEGSFSTNPFQAEIRIAEFKHMVKTFHDNGIGVILDVVYNHTGITEGSNFNLENPGYYYRHNEDGSWANASACGNETSSERPMTRKFILESVKYWAEEYHLDGFRFDLMGIHDIETMNEVSAMLKELNPNIFVYGEGWTAGDSPLPEQRRALKKHATQMPNITVFSDDIRDGLKGSVFDDHSTGFVSGAKNTEESVKFGVVGSIMHPQIDYKAVNYSDAPWANEPWQAISYVSCHDNHTIYDKLKVSRPDADNNDIIAMDKLANAVVMTSQGVAFIHAGAEMLRTKNGEHNSYKSPDSVNQFVWDRKTENKHVVDYYKNLIALRKAHPALKMTTADEVRKNLKFITSENGLVSYEISNNANNDDWSTIHVVYNAKTDAVNYNLGKGYKQAVLGDEFTLQNGKNVGSTISIPKLSMALFYKN